MLVAYRMSKIGCIGEFHNIENYPLYVYGSRLHRHSEECDKEDPRTSEVKVILTFPDDTHKAIFKTYFPQYINRSFINTSITDPVTGLLKIEEEPNVNTAFYNSIPSHSNLISGTTVAASTIGPTSYTNAVKNSSAAYLGQGTI